MSASFGSPVLSTLKRALRKGYLSSLPRFTSALLCKHPPNSVATAMVGHLDRRRQGLDFTAPVPVVPTLAVTISPETYEDDIANISELPGTIIVDDPTSSIMQTLMQQVVIQSHPLDLDIYNGNIYVETMQSRTSAAYILAYGNTFRHWSRYGPVPDIVRLENETSTDLENFLLEDLKVKKIPVFSYSQSSRKSCRALHSHVEKPFHRHTSNRLAEFPCIILE
jgi:hypothetical protein